MPNAKVDDCGVERRQSSKAFTTPRSIPFTVERQGDIGKQHTEISGEFWVN